MDVNIIPLPFGLFEAKDDNKRFRLEFCGFDDGQNARDIRMRGLRGNFAVRYQGEGIYLKFPCELTMGNVHDFYNALRRDYRDPDFITDPKPITLANYGADQKSKLMVTVDAQRKIWAEGLFRNKTADFSEGCIFTIETAYEDIFWSVNAMARFFKMVMKIQGSEVFY